MVALNDWKPVQGIKHIYLSMYGIYIKLWIYIWYVYISLSSWYVSTSAKQRNWAMGLAAAQDRLKG